MKKNSHLYRSLDFVKKVDLDELGEEDDVIYYKSICSVPSKEVPAFLAYCKAIEKRACNLEYAFFIDGVVFAKDGKLKGNSPVKGKMTCVGFCLAVLDGFSYPDCHIKHSDWDSSSHRDNYLAKYCENNGTSEEDIVKYHKRIKPLELFTSAFLTAPVGKSDIEANIKEVEDYFKEKSK